jgi:hypothetical protein
MTRAGLVLFAIVLLLPGSARAWDHKYPGWDALLRRVVDGEGRVDYRAIGEDKALGDFVREIGAQDPREVATWSRDQQAAFYINAYNALTFQTILDAAIPKSIRDIKPDPWEAARWTVAGRDVSLNWIEHEKLRRQLQEPRVHFVLVCAARSCPKLAARAYLPDGLSAQLDAAERAFLTDTARNRVDIVGGKVTLSSILDWYGADFVGWAGTPKEPALSGRSDREAAVLRLLGKHVGEAERAFLGKGAFTVVFADYDWALNGR